MIEGEEKYAMRTMLLLCLQILLNMSTSVAKAKCLVFAKDPGRCKLITQDKPIQQVMQILYLLKNKRIEPVQNLAKNQINRAIPIAGFLGMLCEGRNTLPLRIVWTLPI